MASEPSRSREVGKRTSTQSSATTRGFTLTGAPRLTLVQLAQQPRIRC